MIREKSPLEQLSEIVKNGEDLAGIVIEADNICQHCEPLSPMFCVEQCEVWRTKKDFLEMNGKLDTEGYLHSLLNAVKNDRRQEIIEALHERPRSIEELQERLKSKGYYHSRSTIASSYVEPLMDVGLVKERGKKYRLTLYGRKFEDLLSRVIVEDLLPSHSCCYEETVLRELEDGPKAYADIVGSVPKNILSRTLQRLMENGLITKSRSSAYVFYFRTKKVPKRKFSPTEKKVYEAIPETGASARELSEEVGINLRRIYKYLRRLRRRRLVFTRKRPRTYELTSSGKDVTDFLEETVELVSDASRASTLLLKRFT